MLLDLSGAANARGQYRVGSPDPALILVGRITLAGAELETAHGPSRDSRVTVTGGPRPPPTHALPRGCVLARMVDVACLCWCLTRGRRTAPSRPRGAFTTSPPGGTQQ